MAKKPIIAEDTVDYIRKNKEDLALRYPGLFLVFEGVEILAKFKTRVEALNFTKEKTEAIIWQFDPLPYLVAQRLMVDQVKAKKERAKGLARLRQKKYYEKNHKKILKKRAEKRQENPEKNRTLVKNWYYKNTKRTLAIKKCHRMG